MYVESADTAGNVSTSATFAAKTLVATTTPVDVTAPIITSISVVNGTTTKTITWTTDELATSKVFYSTTTPIDVGSSLTASVSDTSLLTNHSLTISGLLASTTYSFIVQSADATGNTTNSATFNVSPL